MGALLGLLSAFDLVGCALVDMLGLFDGLGDVQGEALGALLGLFDGLGDVKGEALGVLLGLFDGLNDAEGETLGVSTGLLDGPGDVDGAEEEQASKLIADAWAAYYEINFVKISIKQSEQLTCSIINAVTIIEAEK